MSLPPIISSSVLVVLFIFLLAFGCASANLRMEIDSFVAINKTNDNFTVSVATKFKTESSEQMNVNATYHFTVRFEYCSQSYVDSDHMDTILLTSVCDNGTQVCVGQDSPPQSIEFPLNVEGCDAKNADLQFNASLQSPYAGFKVEFNFKIDFAEDFQDFVYEVDSFQENEDLTNDGIPQQKSPQISYRNNLQFVDFNIQIGNLPSFGNGDDDSDGVTTLAPQTSNTAGETGNKLSLRFELMSNLTASVSMNVKRTVTMTTNMQINHVETTMKASYRAQDEITLDVSDNVEKKDNGNQHQSNFTMDFLRSCDAAFGFDVTYGGELSAEYARVIRSNIPMVTAPNTCPETVISLPRSNKVYRSTVDDPVTWQNEISVEGDRMSVEGTNNQNVSIQPTMEIDQLRTNTTIGPCSNSEGCSIKCKATKMYTEDGLIFFNDAHINEVINSVDVCQTSGLPLATIHCINKSSPAFDETTLKLTPCDADISQYISQVPSKISSNQELESILFSVRTIVRDPDNVTLDEAVAIAVLLTKLQDDTIELASSPTPLSEDAGDAILGISTMVGRVVSRSQPVSRDIKQTLGNLVYAMELFAERYSGVDSVRLHSGDIYIRTVQSVKDEAQNIKLQNSGGLLLEANFSSEFLSKFDENVTILTSVYKNSHLFPSAVVPQYVVGASIHNKSVNNLPEFFSMEFLAMNDQENVSETSNPLVLNKTTLRCIYWDTEVFEWLTDGCYLDEETVPPVCYCNHLTNFAIIVSITNIPANFVLSTISLVGLTISIIALACTIIILILTKMYKKGRNTKEMIHVCANFIVGYLIFLFGVEAQQSAACCVVTACMLQYFMLVAWMWIGVYTRDMYISLIDVFSTHKHFMYKAYVLCYMVPFIIALLNVLLAVFYVDARQPRYTLQELEATLIQPSSYISENMCWLTGHSLNFGFLLPIGIILFHNICVFVAILYEINFKSKKVISSAQRTSTYQRFEVAITIGVLVGLSWIFAYFMLLSTDVYYQRIMTWIFTITNSFQGVAIFFLLCVRGNDTRSKWLPVVTSFITNSLLCRHGSSHATRASRSSITFVTSKSTAFPSTSVAHVDHTLSKPTMVFGRGLVETDKL